MNGTLMDEAVAATLPPELTGHRLGGTSMRDQWGRYRWGTWSPIPSVTKILNAANKPLLVPWAAKMVAEEAAAIAQRVVDGQLAGKEALAMLRDVETLKKAPDTRRDDKAAIGTLVHGIAELIARGETINPEHYSEEARPYVASLVRWFARFQPRICAIETMCANREFGYAGTFDTLMVLGSRLMIVDYKTSKDSYPEHSLQLAAYRHAEFIGLSDGKTEIPMPAIDGGAILLIAPEGCRMIEWECGARQFEVFRSLIPVAAWQSATRMAKGREISSEKEVA